MGKRKADWQDIEYILGLFDGRVGVARRRYRAHVAKGVCQGRRPDLVGGGLIRSLGGWVKAKKLREGDRRVKGDERILGDSDFVLEVLEHCDEELERRYALEAKSYDHQRVAGRVAEVFEMEPEQVYGVGKERRLVEARSLFCYWLVRELGVTATGVARMLGISQPSVSISVRRGEKIAKEKGFELLGL